jgi:hypothetical protein
MAVAIRAAVCSRPAPLLPARDRQSSSIKTTFAGSSYRQATVCQKISDTFKIADVNEFVLNRIREEFNEQVRLRDPRAVEIKRQGIVHPRKVNRFAV